jgi:hypothetical protein
MNTLNQLSKKIQEYKPRELRELPLAAALGACLVLDYLVNRASFCAMLALDISHYSLFPAGATLKLRRDIYYYTSTDQAHRIQDVLYAGSTVIYMGARQHEAFETLFYHALLHDGKLVYTTTFVPDHYHLVKLWATFKKV